MLVYKIVAYWYKGTTNALDTTHLTNTINKTFWP